MNETINLNQPTGGNLPDNDIEARGNNKDERLDYRPFKFIPNVRRMRVEISEDDPLFKMHGVNRKLNKANLVTQKYENEHFNRYARHQLNRLSRSDSKLY